MFAVVFVQLARADSPTVFFIWKPKIVAVSLYGMFIISMDLSHDPKAIDLNFWMFTLDPMQLQNIVSPPVALLCQ